MTLDKPHAARRVFELLLKVLDTAIRTTILNVIFVMGKPTNYPVERAFKLIERAHPPEVMTVRLSNMS